MSAAKISKFLQENVVMITGISIIVATHWGWSRLQENPNLVPEDKKRELPIIIGLKYFSKQAMDKISSLSGGGAANTATETSVEKK